MRSLMIGGIDRQKRFISRLHATILKDAANEYSLQRSQGYMHLEFVTMHNPELAKALGEWLDRPELPPPEYPPFET
jgi:hypothetical protein